MNKVNIVIEKDQYGYYSYCPELKGCHSQGDTFEETMANMREAVNLYLETMTEEEIQDAFSSEIVNTSIEVEFAKSA